MKRLVLVNGVPASGKSIVAHAIAQATGWPLLALDTIKEALFAHLGTGDRLYNRKLGQASYQAMFDLVRDFPADATVIGDAWFGFQPADVLAAYIARASIGRTVEVWCHAPPEVIGGRYRARLAGRSPGHLGADYIPELVDLAQRAQPMGTSPVLNVDTTVRLDVADLTTQIRAALGT